MGRLGEEAYDTGGNGSSLSCVEKDDTNKYEENQDARREREHRRVGSISCQPSAVSDKWSNAQARMTTDQQSKVFDTDHDPKVNGSGTTLKASTCALNLGHPHDNVFGEIRRTTEQEDEECSSDSQDKQ